MYLLTLHQYSMEYFRQTCTGKLANKVFLHSCSPGNLYFVTLTFFPKQPIKTKSCPQFKLLVCDCSPGLDNLYLSPITFLVLTTTTSLRLLSWS